MIKIFRKKEITNATEKEYRQYFAGHLKNPQLLEHIDDDVEIGFSNYQKFTADKPHLHPECSEYCYIVSGCSKILMLETNEEFVLNEGDLMHISKNSPYASKHKAGTKVLFIKNPSINDKTLIEISPSLKEWLKKW